MVPEHDEAALDGVVRLGKPLGHIRSHRGCRAQRLMDANKIVASSTKATLLT
jgi:hypothetical protein